MSLKVKELKILTGIRFYAALHVVVFHNLYLFGDVIKLIPEWMILFIRKGESAVSFFFMLSGFILAYVYQDKLKDHKDRKNYLVARLAKLYPLYLLGMILDVPRVVGYFFEKYDLSVALLKIIISGGAYITMLQSWAPSLTPVWNSPAWSLSCEMFFYFCFIPLMPRLLRTWKKNVWILSLYLIPLVIYLGVKKFTTINFESAQITTLWRSLPVLRLTEFCIGVLLYGAILNKASWVDMLYKFRSSLFWISILITIALTSLGDQFPREIFSQMLLLPFFALIILCAYFDDIKMSFFFKTGLFVYLGQVSYAMYILHQPIKYYFELLMAPSLLLGGVYFVGLILICSLIFKYIEIPSQNWIRNRLKIRT